ncbi:MAG: glycosyltransferase family 39 protein [Planctomycetes bacterium]|nr:glycosyltransferase family 39 protein [Planctomycetota bacterium]MCH9727161.1 glycosyltransferase family 39 protein [Planctomycetota bacterium]MCH9778554.1 glycosyltransferase family 39 protein [Planctomycetota bacterium]MCH9791474.1 glycosyltransferase family 39 protein [Planctomycetota bacterium]
MIQTSRSHLILLLILILAGGLRIALVYLQSDQLQQDRDAYLAIAGNLAVGHGYSSTPDPNEIQPTAFRPPLYPALISILYFLNAAPLGIGVIQIILGILTVWLTWQTGKRLQMQWAALGAAAIVATDPILLQYTAYPMTEVLAAFLTSLLLYLLVTSLSIKIVSGEKQVIPPLFFRTGFVWGLAILCRPTYLAFFGIWLVVRFTGSLIYKLHNRKSESMKERKGSPVMYLAAGIMLAVSPWFIRNLVVFHAPILSTTHGGYTLLLGNNPVFYEDVVQKPWGAVWSGESLSVWQKKLEDQISLQVPPLKTEQERDRWMYQRAKYNIAEQPELFVSACILRFKRFWNLSPLTSSALLSTPLVDWGVAGYYLVILFGCFYGTLLVVWNREQKWEPFIWLILSFTVVHLFYWTNMRMRAPLVPAIALLSVYGWSQLGRFFKFSSTVNHDASNQRNIL